jgi:hypothetical protein
LWLLSVAVARPVAECERPYTSAELIEVAVRAEARFADQDPAGFEAAQAEVQARLGCVRDPLSALDVVRVQRVMALGAFFAEDEGGMRAAVAAMARVDITARFPDTVVPRGHRLDRMLDELAGRAYGAGPALASFSDGWIEVNGAFAPNVDAGVSCTLQRIDNQGQVVETRYWRPGESLGDWEASGAAVENASRPTGPARPRAASTGKQPLSKKNDTGSQIARENAAARRVALVASTGAAAVATAVVYSLAADAKMHALDPEESEPQALAYRDQANGLTWGWIGGSVVSGGLLATLVLTW